MVILLLLLLLLLLSPNLSSSQVIGIDFGSNWFKVATIKSTQHIDPSKKPSKDLDLVLNRESKRKTLSLITLRDNHNRFFGSDAAALAPRFPSTTFPHLKSLLGKLANSTDAQHYTSIFPVHLSPHPDRGTVMLHGLANDMYSVEELVAMVLAHAKSQATEYIQKSVTDTVITIPPFFNDAERRSMLAAAKLAGLNVLGLLHDETAVAINYAMTRKFPEPEHHIFYDMGSGSTVTSLVKFESEKQKVTKITVLAVGYDTTLGGLCIDAMIVDYLSKAFTDANKDKLKTSLKSNLRASAKLLKEAARIKEILSVNANVQASIEELHEELNLRVTLTRVQLEEMMKDLEQRVLQPLKAVVSASVPAEKINSLVLVGGGVRVPQIQRWIETEIAPSNIKIAKNINADEAAVMGATWRAVVLARSFRIQKDIQVQDGLPYTISIGAKKPATLFPQLAPMVSYMAASPGVSKTVTLKKKEPLELPITVNRDFGRNELVATVYTKPGNDSIVDQKLTFQLDINGLLTLTNTTATVSIPGSGGLLGLLKSDPVIETIAVESELVFGQVPMSADELKSSESRLNAFDEFERMSQLLETERNTLQSMVYSTRDKVSDTELLKVAKQAELDLVLEKSQEIGGWLDEVDDESTKLEDLQTRRKDLQTQLETVVGRMTQVKKLIKQVRTHGKEMNETSTWVDTFEAKDWYEVSELETYAKDLETRVEEKRRVAAEEFRKQMAELRKREDELRRKREADELIKLAADAMKKVKAENETAAPKPDEETSSTGPGSDGNQGDRDAEAAVNDSSASDLGDGKQVPAPGAEKEKSAPVADEQDQKDSAAPERVDL